MACLVNHKGCRHESFCAVFIDDVLAADEHCIVHVHFLDEGFDIVSAALVQRDAEHPEALSFILVLQLDEMRYLLDTAGAPCCPEVQNHHLALEIRKRDLIAVCIEQCKLRRFSVVGLLSTAT